ncbi:MAG: transcriptional repressor [Bdellovibrionales bacterium]|nr:transcriptional repressor [Bdellovibrionales bacterium]
MSILHPKKEQEKDAACVSLLKEKGLSITAPRKMILSLLMREHGPFSAEEIQKKLPKNSCDQATIYRCLNQFVDVQLVNTSFLEKDMAHFEYNDPHHHHHHIICKICKKIESFHDCLMEKIEISLQKKGYSNIQHRLEIFAICDRCTAQG